MTSAALPDRRAFLARGSLFLGASCLVPVMDADLSAAVRGDEATAGGLSVGYLAGSHRLVDPAEHVRGWTAPSSGWSDDRATGAAEVPPVDVIAARSLPSGDALFGGRGVRFGVHGIHLPEKARADTRLRSCALHVLFPGARSGEGPERRSFLAWHLRTTGVPSCSPSSGCFIPLDDQGEIRLRSAWTWVTPTGRAGTQRVELRLTARRARGAVSLRRGIYVVGLSTDRAASDDLAGHQLTGHSSSGRTPLSRSTWWSTRRESPTIPYLVLSVGYGNHTNLAGSTGHGDEAHV